MFCWSRPTCRSLARRLAVLGAASFCLGAGTASSHEPLKAGGAQDVHPVVVLETSRGDIVIELYPEAAPKSVERFLDLVGSGFYDEMLFHRVVRDYVIQAGVLGMDAEFRGEDVSPIENEAANHLKNMRGAVAMAREDDPHSATTEFFINVRDNRQLDFKAYTKRDWGYAVFGRVVQGMDTVDAIAKMHTRRVGVFRDFPEDLVGIYRAYLVE